MSEVLRWKHLKPLFSKKSKKYGMLLKKYQYYKFLYDKLIFENSQLPSKRIVSKMFFLLSLLFYPIRSLRLTIFFALSINYAKSKYEFISKCFNFSFPRFFLKNEENSIFDQTSNKRTLLQDFPDYSSSIWVISNELFACLY